MLPWMGAVEFLGAPNIADSGVSGASRWQRHLHLASPNEAQSALTKQFQFGEWRSAVERRFDSKPFAARVQSDNSLARDWGAQLQRNARASNERAADRDVGKPETAARPSAVRR